MSQLDAAELLKASGLTKGELQLLSNNISAASLDGQSWSQDSSVASSTMSDVASPKTPIPTRKQHFADKPPQPNFSFGQEDMSEIHTLMNELATTEDDSSVGNVSAEVAQSTSTSTRGAEEDGDSNYHENGDSVSVCFKRLCRSN